MTETVIVLDTSVLFSYAWYPDKPFAILRAIESKRLVAVTSELAIAELREVALRHLDQERVDSFLTRLRSLAKIIAEPRGHFSLDADPEDNLFFNLAIEAGARFLVTYDEAHILAVRDPTHRQYEQFKSVGPLVQIVKPVELAQYLVRSQPQA